MCVYLLKCFTFEYLFQPHHAEEKTRETELARRNRSRLMMNEMIFHFYLSYLCNCFFFRIDDVWPVVSSVVKKSPLKNQVGADKYKIWYKYSMSKWNLFWLSETNEQNSQSATYRKVKKGLMRLFNISCFLFQGHFSWYSLSLTKRPLYILFFSLCSFISIIINQLLLLFFIFRKWREKKNLFVWLGQYLIRYDDHTQITLHLNVLEWCER